MAADREDSGIMEIVAIAVLLFMFWRFYIKDKDKVIEPATTPGELKDEFARDPNFNLNDYCKDVIYRPLSSTDLTPSNILGEGWCYRGDRSAVDESKGFGDAYAEKQAEEYQEMKQEEAVFVNSKSVIQFRLINSTSAPLTTNVLDTTTTSKPFDPIPSSTIANEASNITSFGFSASWSEVEKALGYYLDIATDIDFLSFVSGYENLDIGNATSKIVTSLDPDTTFYYRVRTYNDSGSSSNSNIITVTTNETVIDIDGNIYSITTIGNQQWITENFKCTKYADGTAIPNLTADIDWLAEDGTAGHDGAYCSYDNNPANIAIYGLLYNWYAIINAHELAPAGWRISTDTDWAALESYLVANAGGKLKEEGESHWLSPNSGATDEVRFSALPGGLRLGNALFSGIGDVAYFWSPDGINDFLRRLSSAATNILRSPSYNLTQGFSVRIMRDIP